MAKHRRLAKEILVYPRNGVLCSYEKRSKNVCFELIQSQDVSLSEKSKKYVYDLQKVTIEQLRDALLANWEGY